MYYTKFIVLQLHQNCVILYFGRFILECITNVVYCIIIILLYEDVCVKDTQLYNLNPISHGGWGDIMTTEIFYQI